MWLCPSSSCPGHPAQGPLTCAWRVKWQLVVGRGDTGHVGPFHLSQAVVVSKGTMEVFIHSQGGQPGDRQGDLGMCKENRAGKGFLGGGGGEGNSLREMKPEYSEWE